MTIFKTFQGLENFYIKFQDFPYFSRISTNPEELALQKNQHKTANLWFNHLFTTFGQEAEQVHSYNPGARHGAVTRQTYAHC